MQTQVYTLNNQHGTQNMLAYRCIPFTEQKISLACGRVLVSIRTTPFMTLAYYRDGCSPFLEFTMILPA